MRKRYSSLKEVTHDQIREAMESFRQEGGKITILPDQRVRQVSVIGEEKWGAYEAIHDLTL